MSLQIAFIPGFVEALSDAAKSLVDHPTKKVHEDTVYFCKTVQCPVKGWYGTKMAQVLNALVAEGVVTGVLATGWLELAAGRIAMDTGLMDLGPDRYAAVFMFFDSKLSREELNKRFGKCFWDEGQIPQYDTWFDIVKALEA